MKELQRGWRVAVGTARADHLAMFLKRPATDFDSLIEHFASSTFRDKCQKVPHKVLCDLPISSDVSSGVPESFQQCCATCPVSMKRPELIIKFKSLPEIVATNEVALVRVATAIWLE